MRVTFNPGCFLCRIIFIFKLFLLISSGKDIDIWTQFKTNGAPSGGKCHVIEPASKNSFDEFFEFYCENWSDSVNAWPLKYNFENEVWCHDENHSEGNTFSTKLGQDLITLTD